MNNVGGAYAPKDARQKEIDEMTEQHTSGAVRAGIASWMQGTQDNAMRLSRLPNASLEDRFWPVDDVVCAIAPDGDPALFARWSELYDQCKAADPTFIPRRNKIRGIPDEKA